ncbi:uncharacterized protein LOC125954611 [Anopheles darlingi]|uniref:uncharacterized protein LOC125954611 n=1 Tax=Anopheles darlingi TaxID=43151 RepID=UPI0021005358|nr:uncharacterized protein LOC125954611 [Anopheles darlingi]
MDATTEQTTVARIEEKEEEEEDTTDRTAADSSPSICSSTRSSNSCTNSECRKSSVYVYGGGTGEGGGGGAGGNGGPFTITLKHYDSLVSEVKCPGCAEPMDGAISLCATGHSLCDGCRHKCAQCPLCGARFTELRNYTLEAIASKVQFPCRNAARGCTVRLPLQLLRWHRERCGYKLIECFMGKVWDGCSWQGCERTWLAHCVAAHPEQVYDAAQLELRWDYGAEVAAPGTGTGTAPRTTQLQLVVAYYLARAHGEAFNLYQVFDPDSRTVLWTVICATKEPKVSARFAFELELYSTVDSWKLLVQRFPCHSELDPDFLKDGHCAKIPLGEAIRYMAPDKVLYYRVRILEVGPSRCQSLATISSSTPGAQPLPAADYSCTSIEHVNLKAVPADNIIIRKQAAVAPPSTETNTSDHHHYNEDDDVFLPAHEEKEKEEKEQESRLYRWGSSGDVPATGGTPPEKPARVTFDQLQQNALHHHQQQQQQQHQLVRARLVDQEQPARVRLVEASSATNGRARSAEQPRMSNGSCDSLVNRQPGSTTSKPATGLSRFYNVTMYKAAKYLEKKSQHRPVS